MTESPYFIRRKPDIPTKWKIKVRENHATKPTKRKLKNLTLDTHAKKSRGALSISPYFDSGIILPSLESFGPYILSLKRSSTDPDSSALLHFKKCPTFLSAYELQSDNLGSEERIKTSVRHLCRHSCYFRAYVAVREWHKFYKRISADACSRTSEFWD